MPESPRPRFAVLHIALLILFLPMVRVQAQDRAREAPFSCEPVVSGSIAFRGFALANYAPADNAQRVRFQIEEPFIGLADKANEIEVPLEVREAIRAGEERIVASLPDEDGPHWSAETFDEAAEKPYLQYLRGLPFGKAPARILGWTSGPDDSPLAHTRVRAVGAGHQHEAESNERGTFEFSGVAPGRYRVTAIRPGFETVVPFREVEVVPAGCGVVSLLFEFQGIIQGAVKDRRGNPQPGIRIELVQIDGDNEAPFETTETDADGLYRFTGIDPGRYRVGVNLLQVAPREPYPKLYAPGVEETAKSFDVTLSEGQPSAVADLWLPDPKLRRFEIDIFWPNGSPAKDATVALMYGRWHEPGELRTNDHGSLVLQGYQLLDYRMYAFASTPPGDEAASLPQVVASGPEKIWLRFVLTAKRIEIEAP